MSLKAKSPKNVSIRNRLLLQSGFVAIIISTFLFLIVRLVLAQAVTATQDGLLSAAVNSLVDNIYLIDSKVSLDLPYDTFSLLGAVGEDRIFYRVEENGKFLTGYEELAYQGDFGLLNEPAFSTLYFLNETFRAAAIEHIIFIGDDTRSLKIIIAQSQNFQTLVLKKISDNLIIVTLIFLVIALLLAFMTANLAISPINKFADDVKMRGPSDLRKVSDNVPAELIPLARSLNGFITRFRTALRQTETFIAEAAHHIRTPLAVVKSESELALRKSKTPENRDHLRKIIRSVEQTNRSASQMLDHAMVLYLTERPEKQLFPINRSLQDTVNQFIPAAELRDLEISFTSQIKPKQMVTLDRTLLETVFRNLLDNALKYSKEETEIQVIAIERNSLLEIRIINTTDRPERLNTSQIFQKFKRGSVSKDIIGSGLGLSIALEAANAIDAKITIKKQKGGTVCASLFLPY